MFGPGKEPPLTVLREADVIAAAIQHALAEASPQERPGLEHAAQLVAEEQRLTDTEVRTRWVRNVLSEAGITPGANHVAAVKAVREAVGGSMRLRDANEIVSEADPNA
ncbi:hypothetical protein [Streptomyces sp. Je 1-332]|uniref:hypothetical protein n=1 Tax=Streptomyces sp. Je 1-332 TaxID=3231270 RepID=UPI003458D422